MYYNCLRNVSFFYFLWKINFVRDLTPFMEYLKCGMYNSITIHISLSTSICAYVSYEGKRHNVGKKMRSKTMMTMVTENITKKD